MHTLIFDSYEEFAKRKDKTINGVSRDFAEKNSGWYTTNRTNEGCWNCIYCSGCKDSSHCKLCSQLNQCNYLSNCKKCFRCSRCTNCTICDYCFDCSRCAWCVGAEFIELGFKLDSGIKI